MMEQRINKESLELHPDDKLRLSTSPGTIQLFVAILLEVTLPVLPLRRFQLSSLVLAHILHLQVIFLPFELLDLTSRPQLISDLGVDSDIGAPYVVVVVVVIVSGA
jgi:hypothetical protein